MKETTLLGLKLKVAENWWERCRGLIGRAAPAPGEGLLIPHCNAIHTFFMRYPINAIFLDKHDQVVKKAENIRPWRLWVWGGFKAVKVIETAFEK